MRVFRFILLWIPIGAISWFSHAQQVSLWLRLPFVVLLPIYLAAGPLTWLMFSKHDRRFDWLKEPSEPKHFRSTSTGNRLADEKEWHERHFQRPRPLPVSAAIRQRYTKRRRVPLSPREELFKIIGDPRGKRILVYGCGDDNLVPLLDLMGAEVTAFDLSAQALGIQQAMAAANGTTPRLAQAAAEQLPFASEAFEAVVGTAILHHLPDALAGVPGELRRVLQPGGQALFIEPVNFSPWFARIRQRVPIYTALSPGERQLTETDLAVFAGAQRHYFRLLARFDRFTIPNGILETAPFWRRFATWALYLADRALLTFPPVRRFAGTIVLQMLKQ